MNSADQDGGSGPASDVDDPITLPAVLADQIFRLVVDALPDEGFGVLGMVRGEVTHVYFATNIDASASLYTLEPKGIGAGAAHGQRDRGADRWTFSFPHERCSVAVGD